MIKYKFEIIFFLFLLTSIIFILFFNNTLPDSEVIYEFLLSQSLYIAKIQNLDPYDIFLSNITDYSFQLDQFTQRFPYFDSFRLSNLLRFLFIGDNIFNFKFVVFLSLLFFVIFSLVLRTIVKHLFFFKNDKENIFFWLSFFFSHIFLIFILSGTLPEFINAFLLIIVFYFIYISHPSFINFSLAIFFISLIFFNRYPSIYPCLLAFLIAKIYINNYNFKVIVYFISILFFSFVLSNFLVSIYRNFFNIVSSNSIYSQQSFDDFFKLALNSLPSILNSFKSLFLTTTIKNTTHIINTPMGLPILNPIVSFFFILSIFNYKSLKNDKLFIFLFISNFLSLIFFSIKGIQSRYILLFYPFILMQSIYGMRVITKKFKNDNVLLWHFSYMIMFIFIFIPFMSNNKNFYQTTGLIEYKEMLVNSDNIVIDNYAFTPIINVSYLTNNKININENNFLENKFTYIASEDWYENPTRHIGYSVKRQWDKFEINYGLINPSLITYHNDGNLSKIFYEVLDHDIGYWSDNFNSGNLNDIKTLYKKTDGEDIYVSKDRYMHFFNFENTDKIKGSSLIPFNSIFIELEFTNKKSKYLDIILDDNIKKDKIFRVELDESKSDIQDSITGKYYYNSFNIEFSSQLVIKKAKVILTSNKVDSDIINLNESWDEYYFRSQ